MKTTDHSGYIFDECMMTNILERKYFLLRNSGTSIIPVNHLIQGLGLNKTHKQRCQSNCEKIEDLPGGKKHAILGQA